MSNELQIMERLELKLDVAILMTAGVTRAEAEERVYLPAIHRLIGELKDTVRQLRQMQGKVG